MTPSLERHHTVTLSTLQPLLYHIPVTMTTHRCIHLTGPNMIQTEVGVKLGYRRLFYIDFWSAFSYHPLIIQIATAMWHVTNHTHLRCPVFPARSLTPLVTLTHNQSFVASCAMPIVLATDVTVACHTASLSSPPISPHPGSLNNMPQLPIMPTMPIWFNMTILPTLM